MAGAHNVRESSEPNRVEVTSYNGWTHPMWNSNDEQQIDHFRETNMRHTSRPTGTGLYTAGQMQTLPLGTPAAAATAATDVPAAAPVDGLDAAAIAAAASAAATGATRQLVAKCQTCCKRSHHSDCKCGGPRCRPLPPSHLRFRGLTNMRVFWGSRSSMDAI